MSPAARALKCSSRTVYRYIDNHPTLKATMSEERGRMIDVAEAALFTEIQNGNITAIIFTLKTVGKDRGYVERLEQTGRDGAPMKHQHEVNQTGTPVKLTEGILDTHERFLEEVEHARSIQDGGAGESGGAGSEGAADLDES